MSTWKITNINNSTHAVTVKSDSGEILNISIPSTHREPKLGREYVKSQTDAHDAAKLIPPVVVVKKFPYVPCIITALVTIIAVLIIIKV
jgi:hypothetical protein